MPRDSDYRDVLLQNGSVAYSHVLCSAGKRPKRDGAESKPAREKRSPEDVRIRTERGKRGSPVTRLPDHRARYRTRDRRSCRVTGPLGEHSGRPTRSHRSDRLIAGRRRRFRTIVRTFYAHRHDAYTTDVIRYSPGKG